MMKELAWSWGIALLTLLLVALIQIIAFRHFAPADRFRFLRRLFARHALGRLGGDVVEAHLRAWLVEVGLRHLQVITPPPRQVSPS